VPNQFALFHLNPLCHYSWMASYPCLRRSTDGRSYLYLGLLACGAALGGLLFGYDTAVISGAIGFIEAHFKLSAGMTGWAASSLLVGCMFGAMFGGPLSDRFGRKPMLLCCSVVFALSGLGSAVASNLTIYTWSRLLGGLGIGAVSDPASRHNVATRQR
jgi:MFS transporter, SP family, arabinose:H+ symporter